MIVNRKLGTKNFQTNEESIKTWSWEISNGFDLISCTDFWARSLLNNFFTNNVFIFLHNFWSHHFIALERIFLERISLLSVGKVWWNEVIKVQVSSRSDKYLWKGLMQKIKINLKQDKMS